MGTGHIFFVGLINDVVMGFPLGMTHFPPRSLFCWKLC